MARWAVETRLEFTTKSSKAHLRVVRSYVSKRIAAVVVWRPLPRNIVAVLRIINAVGLLVDARAALDKVSYEFGTPNVGG